MADADILGVVQQLLVRALEESARGGRTAREALESARRMGRPESWADVLPWVLARASELDDRLSVRATADTVSLRVEEHGRWAAVSVVAAGSAPPEVRVTIDGPVDLRSAGGPGTLTVTGSGRGTWRIDTEGPSAPDGDAEVSLAWRMRLARPVVEVPGVVMGLGGDVRVEARLASRAPLWSLDVRAPALEVTVTPASLLDLPAPGRQRLAVLAGLTATDGAPPVVSLGPGR